MWGEIMERLKELRTNAHMTQKMMADYLQIDRTTYVKYEKGLSEPNFATIIRIADYFSVSVDYLIGHNNDRQICDDKENQPAASGSELDEKIISALVDLTPAETLRVLDFVSGIKASRKE